MSDAPGPAPVPIELVVPDDMTVGVYANIMSIWTNGPHDFTLDFAVVGMPEVHPERGMVAAAQVVARIKVAPSIVFLIAQAIAQNVDKYEKMYGPITPRPPDASPSFSPEES